MTNKFLGHELPDRDAPMVDIYDAILLALLESGPSDMNPEDAYAQAERIAARYAR
jgi:hypothetical protein